MAPHPLFKQSSITPLPLPLHFSFTQFSSQSNMLHPTKQIPKSYLNFSDHFNHSHHSSTTYDHAVNQDSKLNYRFKPEKTFTLNDDDDETEMSTPLWKTTPQHENNINFRCLSPSSRAEAIARGQKELMEMVSKMPESCYELTLKDLVEHQPVVVVETEQESFGEGRVSSSIDEPNKYKKENQKPQIKRSGSVDNGGFLLKMVFPVSLGSKKKKKMKPRKNDCNTSSNSKVSPNPTVTEHTSGNSKTVDKDWWKKRTGSSESDGTGSTINSGSTKTSRSSSRSSGSYRSISSTSRRHRRNSCLAFILCRKNKA